jgi:toxin YoeB
MRTIAFHQSAFDQYNEWALRDKHTFERLRRLIAETARTPFAGIGKPEPLKRELSQGIGHAGSQTSTGSSIRRLTTN